MILLIDNYDSFSYNLYQLVGSIEPDIKVIRNDAMTVDEICEMSPDAIILSPGPGRPEDAGVCIDVVRRLGPKIPILGVCLGHQAVCAAFGATISYAGRLMHGKQSDVTLELSCTLFRECSPITTVARYHSLAAIDETIPECLMITARADDGEIMAVKHRNYNIYGVQFHPESFMTPEGEKMMKNFIEIGVT
jgi:anthranilate synthase component 2